MKVFLLSICMLFTYTSIYALETALIEHRHELSAGIVGGFYDKTYFISGLGGQYRGEYELFKWMTAGLHGIFGYNLLQTNLIYGGGLDLKFKILELDPIYSAVLVYGSSVFNNYQNILGGGLTALVTFDQKFFFMTLSCGGSFDFFNNEDNPDSLFLYSLNYGANIMVPVNDSFNIGLGAEISQDKLNIGISVNFCSGSQNKKK